MELLRYSAILAAFVVFISDLASGESGSVQSNFTITVLHMNDIHGRFMETSRDSLACSVADSNNGKCYGGYARLFTKVTEIRRTHPNVILLSGGDYDRGTIWHTVYNWKAFTHFTNMFNYTAMTLGNHDFDESVDGVVPLLDALESPVVVSNILDSEEPSLQGKYNKSIVIEMDGKKIGIIGYISNDTSKISHTGKLGFVHEVDSIRDEAAKLHNSGVNIIIALGHSGYKKDLRIAQVPYVDLVVGAHTHTFLYSGGKPDIEVPRAPYPTVVTQKISGKKVPVVQAYAYTKYLGYLNISFDDNGEVLTWNGNPILLDASIPQDPEMLAELEAWSEQLKQYTANVVGHTKVFLNGSCRAGECNLGSFFADSMCYGYNNHARAQRRAIPSKINVHIAMLNSGSLRTSLGTASQNGNPSNITMSDVLTLLPFRNSIDLVEIKGKYLRTALEQSVASSDVDFGRDGKFLQVSGLRITFNMTAPSGHRVQSVHVKVTSKKYNLLTDESVYRILVNDFIAQGGDGYAMFKDNSISLSDTGLKDVELLLEYIKYKSPIVQTNDGRIVIEAAPNTKSSVRGTELARS